MTLCHHCGAHESGPAGSCACMICAPFPIKVAPCVCCLNREKMRKRLAYVETFDIDVRDTLNWVLHRPEAPSSPYRTLKGCE